MNRLREMMTGEYGVFWQVLLAGLCLFGIWWLVDSGSLWSIIEFVISIPIWLLYIPLAILTFFVETLLIVLPQGFRDGYEENGLLFTLLTLMFVILIMSGFLWLAILFIASISIRLSNMGKPSEEVFTKYSSKYASSKYVSSKYISEQLNQVYDTLAKPFLVIITIIGILIASFSCGIFLSNVFGLNEPIYVLICLLIFSIIIVRIRNRLRTKYSRKVTPYRD